MFSFKKVFAIGAALAALAVPTLASADDYDHVRVEHVQHREGSAIERLRIQIARERAELARDRRQIVRYERHLHEMVRGRR